MRFVALLAILGFSTVSSVAAPSAKELPTGPISVAVTQQSLAGVVERLAAVSGTPLRVRSRSLGQHPTQLFVRDRPLKEVLAELARLVESPPGKCTWEPCTIRGRAGFELVESERSGFERERAQAKRARARAARFREELGLALRISRMTPDQLEELRKSRRELALWRHTTPGADEYCRGPRSAAT